MRERAMPGRRASARLVVAVLMVLALSRLGDGTTTQRTTLVPVVGIS